MTILREILGDVKEFGGLMDRIEEVLQGERLHNVVPALVTLLGEAGWMSEMPKQDFVEFVKESVDATYDVMEATHGKRRASQDH